MQRWRFWLLISAGLLLVGGIVAGVIRTSRFQKWYDPPTLVIPADQEVAEVRCSLRASQWGTAAIPEFVVPAEHVPVILGWLRPAEYIREPWRLDLLEEWGEIIVKTRGGSEVRLRFYDAGKNPAILTADAVDQFWAADHSGVSAYGVVGLLHAVQNAYKASQR